MPRTDITTTYQIAHDSGDMLSDLIDLVDWVNSQIQGSSIRFESCKSDYGLVVVEISEE